MTFCACLLIAGALLKRRYTNWHFRYTNWHFDWLINCGFTSHSTQNGSFRRHSRSQSVVWYGKTKPNTTKAQIHQSKEMYYNTKWRQKTKQCLVACYDIRPGNGHGLFWFWCFINLSLIYLLRHLPTYLQPRDPILIVWRIDVLNSEHNLVHTAVAAEVPW